MTTRTLYEWVPISEVDLSKLEDLNKYPCTSDKGYHVRTGSAIKHWSGHGDNLYTILLPVEVPERVSDEEIECQIESLNQPQITKIELARYIGEWMRDRMLPLLCNKSVMQEARYLLYKYQEEKCPEWKEGVGDCQKPECLFCRIQKCIDELEQCESTSAIEPKPKLFYLIENKENRWYCYDDLWTNDVNFAIQFDTENDAAKELVLMCKKEPNTFMSCKVTEHEYITTTPPLKIVEPKGEEGKAIDALKELYKEAEVLKSHIVEQSLIDWEDGNIDGCKDFDKALENARKIIFQ